MSVSSNAFTKEVKRHFGKYSPYEKSRMYFKFSLALTLFSLALTATGVFVDQFHEDDPETFTLRNGREFKSAGVTVGHLQIRLDFPDCTTLETADRENSRLFDPKGVMFRDLVKGPMGDDEVFDAFVNPGDHSVSEAYFGTFETYYTMGRIAVSLSYAAMGLLLLSAIISVVTQTPPNSFMSGEPTFNQTPSQYMWGSVHHGLSIVAAVLLMVDLAIVSTYLDLILGRVIEIGFELCNFNPGETELEIMRIYGDFLEDYSRVNGATGMAYKVSIFIILLQATIVFLIGINKVRDTVMGSHPQDTVLSLPASKLRQLPWYCSIWRMQFSVLFFLVALIADLGTSVYSRTHGYALNLYAWRTLGSARTGSGSTQTGALSDVIMDMTSTYYISDSIPGTVTMGWLSFVVALGLGSTDATRFFSKVIQMFGILIALRSVISVTTIVPVPSTVITTPFCYDEPNTVSFELRSILDRSLGCNHAMFSAMAAFTTVSIGVMLMYVRFGPMKRRLVGYIVLSLCAIVSAMLPIVARMNYSYECYVAFCISVLLLLTQSASFQLLFRYENTRGVFTGNRLRPTVGVLVNDNLIPLLSECMKRLQLYQMGVKLSPALQLLPSEFDEIIVLYEAVGRAVNVAKEAKPKEPISSAGMALEGEPTTTLRSTPPPNNTENLADIIAQNQSISSPRISEADFRSPQRG